MAKLICTEEENKTLTFLEWDEVSLGRGVKALATNIFHEKDARKSLKVTAAAVALICECIDSGSELTTIDLAEAFQGDRQLGDWTITLTRKSEI